MLNIHADFRGLLLKHREDEEKAKGVIIKKTDAQEIL